MNTPKQLWMLTGANGSGKSTFYQQFLAATRLPFINADILARQLDAENAEAMSYKAAMLAEKLRTQLLQAGVSFCFESVFSHPSKIDFLAATKALNYEIILVYIHLKNVELNQARVAQRVMRGGHNVPTDKIISRIPRTLRYVKQALPLADAVKLYDNSSHSRPYLAIAQLTRGKLEIQQNPLPDWACEMLAV
ncbi:MAG TPA: dephospho-CoA kinase [Gammaproteobacteria bacterium]|nr:dephospho-CoA kinase [Gammaproteobacteria bacterium]